MYAVVRSDWAWPATALAAETVPLTSPGGNPVIAVPGLTPRSPLITDGPVFVTVWPPRTPKLSAVPSPTAGCAAWAVAVSATRRSNAKYIGIDLCNWWLPAAHPYTTPADGPDRGANPVRRIAERADSRRAV